MNKTLQLINLKTFCPQHGENGPKAGFFNLLENWVINFFWIWSIKKFYNICCVLAQSHTWENCGSWDMGQNALDQSACSIFKLTMSLEQIDKKAWFFAYWYRFIQIKSWLKNIGVGIVKTGCGHSGLRTLKLVVSLEGINRVSWFLVCW